MNLEEFTKRELYKFKHTSSKPQGEHSSIDDMVIFVFKPTMTSGMQVTIEIVNVLQAIALTLGITLSLDYPKNRKWYHAPAGSPSIEL